MPQSNTRIEHDLLGDLAVPADAYSGVQTARALDNFKISGVQLRQYPNFITGLAMVKLAAGRANFETDGFSKEILESGEGILELIREKHFLTDAQIDEILNPAALTEQGR